MSELRVLAPFDGWCAALAEVPDEVFAAGLVGDGLAVDPVEGLLVAPCAGEIIMLAKTGHAVSIRTAWGHEVLVHVGIDTVALGGTGFETLTRPGALVRAGDALIRFDLDIVARGAKSLMTPIVISGTAVPVIRERRAPGRVRAGEVIYVVDTSRQAVAPLVHGNQTVERGLTLRLRHGLHARPAALVTQSLKQALASVTVRANGRQANGRSVVALLLLGARHGDALTIEATGADADAAVAACIAAIETAMRREDDEVRAGSATRPTPANASAAVPPPAAADGDGRLYGVTAVAGFALGSTFRLERAELPVAESGWGVDGERAALAAAQRELRSRLQRAADPDRGDTGPTRDILAAHAEFLDDPLVNEHAQVLIGRGNSAGFAWRAATRDQVATLRALEDPRLRERADDLLDVEAQLQSLLAGGSSGVQTPIPAGSVLLAQDLLPSQLAAMDGRQLAAICLEAGGATSHVAILAAAMNVPMLVGIGPVLRTVPAATSVIVDAGSGLLQWRPAAADLEAAAARLARGEVQRSVVLAAAAIPCRTCDGARIEVFANVGSLGDAVAAVANGAEGCGLLRTEFLFIDRDTAPDEDEQLQAYQAIAAALGPRTLVLRLMDVGGDKPLKYLPQAHEDNPALGLRGIRTALRRPDLLRTQLRAALRIAPPGVVQILIPMVTDLAEVIEVRALADDIARELGRANVIRCGAMIETPAAALLSRAIVQAVDFLSIGSNDLTQYALAMDRGHPELARRSDPLHPAVLQLMALAAQAGTEAGKPVAVCGSVAADRMAVPLLLGIGIRELSVVPAAIPQLKRQIAGLELDGCRRLAAECLALASSAEVRNHVGRWLEHRGDHS